MKEAIDSIINQIWSTSRLDAREEHHWLKTLMAPKTLSRVYKHFKIKIKELDDLKYICFRRTRDSRSTVRYTLHHNQHSRKADRFQLV